MKLKIGLPDGSLVNPQRGGLRELLERARIFTRNWEEGNKSAEITNIDWLEAIVQRPQELPFLAAEEYCDLFFCGDDWAREWELRGYPRKKLVGLGIGKVDIVVAEKPGYEGDYSCASEYPFIAADYVSKIMKVDRNAVQLIKYGEQAKNGPTIIDSFGKTELKQVYGIADLIVENTQTGKTLSDLGFVIVDTIMNSECSLYIRKGLEEDIWKIKKAERIAMMLQGAIDAYGKDLVIFNVPNDRLEEVLMYVRKKRLFGDNETVVPGKPTSEMILELTIKDPNRPYIDTIGDLVDLGATKIDAVPLNYSIK